MYKKFDMGRYGYQDKCECENVPMKLLFTYWITGIRKRGNQTLPDRKCNTNVSITRDCGVTAVYFTPNQRWCKFTVLLLLENLVLLSSPHQNDHYVTGVWWYFLRNFPTIYLISLKYQSIFQLNTQKYFLLHTPRVLADGLKSLYPFHSVFLGRCSENVFDSFPCS